MRPGVCLLTPSSSLPSLRRLGTLSEDDVFSALQGLTRVYCPLSFNLSAKGGRKPVEDLSLADSGYVSGTEEDGDGEQQALEQLRADDFERSFAERWLTGFLARAEELPCFTSDEARERAVEQASCVLESFFTNTGKDEQVQGEHDLYAREFSFEVAVRGTPGEEASIDVRLNDGLAGTNSEEPDDVGLQSWGAAILFSQLICAEPERFHLSQSFLGDAPRIVELGAGTGLFSLVLARLLPRLGIANPKIIATDYHPAVLDNMRANIVANLPSSDAVEAAHLDWSAPSSDPPFDVPARMLFATDVVYGPQHAVWLRDCATELLAPDGVFWLVVTLRETGRFEGVSDTVEAAFSAEDRPRGRDGRRLAILHEERVEKRSGIGRGDESGYKYVRIGWA